LPFERRKREALPVGKARERQTAAVETAAAFGKWASHTCNCVAVAAAGLHIRNGSRAWLCSPTQQSEICAAIVTAVTLKLWVTVDADVYTALP
jgi:hypothetical protein